MSSHTCKRYLSCKVKTYAFIEASKSEKAKYTFIALSKNRHTRCIDERICDGICNSEENSYLLNRGCRDIGYDAFSVQKIAKRLKRHAYHKYYSYSNGRFCEFWSCLSNWWITLLFIGVLHWKALLKPSQYICVKDTEAYCW